MKDIIEIHQRGYEDMPVWGVVWEFRLVTAAARRLDSARPTQALVTTNAGLMGDRCISHGLTKTEAQALADLINAGEQNGKD